MPDIKTVLTDETIASIATSLGYDKTLTSGRRYKLARAIEAAVLAASAPAQEPVAKVTNLYGDPEAFGERGLKINDATLQKLPYGTKLYAAPVDAQDAVDKASIVRLCKQSEQAAQVYRRTYEKEGNEKLAQYWTGYADGAAICIRAIDAGLQASQSPQDQVKP